MAVKRIPANAERGWHNDFRALIQSALGFPIEDPTYGGGADPTTAADSTAAIAAAISAGDLSGNDRGVKLSVPRGVYKTSGLSFVNSDSPNSTPLSIIGELATMGNITGSTGSNLIPTANGQTILTLGTAAHATHAGSHLENLNFYAGPSSFTGCTGLIQDGTCHWRGLWLGFKDLAVGLDVRANASTDSAWNLLLSPIFYNCLTAGLKTTDIFGLVNVGGDFNVSDPGTGAAYGLWITGSASNATQSYKSFGAFFDSQNHPSLGRVLGVYIDRGHECLIEGTKFEQLDTGIEITNLDAADSGAGAMNIVSNCTFVAGVSDIGIQVDANASDTHIINPSATSVGTGIVNNGLRTKVFGGRLDVTTPWTGTEPEMFGVTINDGTGRVSKTRLQGPFARKRSVLTYGATVNTNCALGNLFTVTATNGTAFTIAAPTRITNDQEITYTIRNTSGGALGVVTWNAVFKMAAWTSPATANSRSISFVWDGTNWIETSRTPADVPN